MLAAGTACALIGAAPIAREEVNTRWNGNEPWFCSQAVAEHYVSGDLDTRIEDYVMSGKLGLKPGSTEQDLEWICSEQGRTSNEYLLSSLHILYYWNTMPTFPKWLSKMATVGVALYVLILRYCRSRQISPSTIEKKVTGEQDEKDPPRHPLTIKNVGIVASSESKLGGESNANDRSIPKLQNPEFRYPQAYIQHLSKTHKKEEFESYELYLRRKRFRCMPGFEGLKAPEQELKKQIDAFVKNPNHSPGSSSYIHQVAQKLYKQMDTQQKDFASEETLLLFKTNLEYILLTEQLHSFTNT